MAEPEAPPPKPASVPGDLIIPPAELAVLQAALDKAGSEAAGCREQIAAMQAVTVAHRDQIEQLKAEKLKLIGDMALLARTAAAAEDEVKQIKAKAAEDLVFPIQVAAEAEKAANRLRALLEQKEAEAEQHRLRGDRAVTQHTEEESRRWALEAEVERWRARVAELEHDCEVMARGVGDNEVEKVHPIIELPGLMELLKKLEWDQRDNCPLCHRHKTWGHRGDCPLRPWVED